ncbi:GNAT family N-acetyltransferase [uncultured Arthrobacter sp.]|uniref:GNAT family N-acetyltransferase n=1 Tax=uncultured Arthrobacter sp. TaxID=114050 RepID=UPI0025FC43A5|nr:GNAT family protein [uncultured Arthrobacter sp.]
MHITLRAMGSDDADAAVEFLTSNTFPFHLLTSPTPGGLRSGVQAGRFWNEETQGYWIDDAGRCIGMAVLQDLRDDTPMFDLRLGDSHRGRGAGTAALRALCALVFTTMPDVVRFEGQTREDNIAMRRTFLRAGFLKEAHYRLGWPTADGGRLASVAYSILRQDWEFNTVTPLNWDDLPD